MLHIRRKLPGLLQLRKRPRTTSNALKMPLGEHEMAELDQDAPHQQFRAMTGAAQPRTAQRRLGAQTSLLAFAFGSSHIGTGALPSSAGAAA